MRRTPLFLLCLCAVTACDAEPEPGDDAGTAMDGARPAEDGSAGDDAASSDAGIACEVDDDCSDFEYCTGEELCTDGRCVFGSPPCSAEMCDEETDSCACANPDVDGDGVDSIACGGDDCDDDDANRYPGNPEVCDEAAHDEDCDLSTYGVRDVDGDGVDDAACCNDDGATRQCGTDCDDSAPGTHPTATEVCDGVDNDCDEGIDERVQITFYPDADGDGYGVTEGPTVSACFPPDGYAEMDGDCDDDPATGGAIHPGAVDVCDAAGIDNDCSGVGNDPPEGCACAGTETRDCLLAGLCRSGNETCLDGTWGTCSIQPVAETCDGQDEDCDGVIDNGVTIVCYLDVDDDTYAVSGEVAVDICPDGARAHVGGCPAGYTNRPPMSPDLDCDGVDSTRSPGHVELCNGVDDDCDGSVDETTTVTCYVDTDSDRYAPSGIPPVELCPDATRPTYGQCPVGYTATPPGPGTIDCDDTEGSVYPGAPEICNGIDDDCDFFPDEGTTVTCYSDVDRDTYAPVGGSSALCPDETRPEVGECPVGYTNRAPSGVGAVDCNDFNDSVSPVAEEVCNGIDDDCDGTPDEGTTVTCYADSDGDTYAAGGAAAQSLCPDETRTSVGGCPVGYTNRAPTGVGAVDCNDLDGTRSPAEAEVCNGADDDCDGTIDDGVTVECYVDADNDTYAPPSAGVLNLCPASGRDAVGGCPVGYTNRSPALQSDCDDTRASRRPDIAETVCDGLDDNCNGATDEGVQTTFYRDADNDGYGNPTISTLACSAPGGFVTDASDCNDSSSSVHPTAPELCNCRDDDCDLSTDEDLPLVGVWRDDDGDGHGVDMGADGVADAMRCLPSSPTEPLCYSGFARTNDDCDDEAALVYPGANEICLNGVDDDCSGEIDDNTPIWYRDNDLDGYGDDDDTVAACDVPSTGQWTHRGGDCGPSNPNVYPGAPELCDGLDTDCDRVARDAGEVDNDHGLNFPGEDDDGDGHGDVACNGGTPAPFMNDCDDDNASVYTGAFETIGNGIDNDCDGVEICYVDADSDGHRSMDELLTVESSDNESCDDDGEGHRDEPPDDCDETSPTVYPGANEIVGNQIDNDCDGGEICFVDADDDLHARADGATIVSDDPDCADGAEAPASLPRDDCDDADWHVNPARLDSLPAYIGNEVDNDCNGGEVCYVDADGDGHRRTDSTTVTSSNVTCTDAGEAPASYPADDCNDSVGTIYWGATEIVGDGIDQSCDGTEICFRDADDDGHRHTNTALTTASADADCADPFEGHLGDPADDCDDTRADRFPGHPEIIGNGVDNDCNGGEICYLDDDNDGFRPGTGTATRTSTDADCDDTDEAYSTEPTGDCDDANASRYPGNLDNFGANVGNGVDNDCNGQEICFVDADNDDYRPSPSGSCTTTANCAANRACVGGQCHPVVVSSNASCGDAGEATSSQPTGDCVDGGTLGPYHNPGLDDRFPPSTGDQLDNDCDGVEYCYRDADNDGYRLTTIVLSADLDCLDSGEARSNEPTGDCCDSNANARPNQTAYFTSTTGCAGPPTPNYDYNCSGGNNRRYPSLATACAPRSVAGSSCIDYTGWQGSVPTCGSGGTFQTGCSETGSILCVPTTVSRTQSCR